MRRQRTIYFNDARHFYLFVFEPPMRVEDMWRPVDEVAGTGVDTLVYGGRAGGRAILSVEGGQVVPQRHGRDR